jgi:NADP-dependent 3-hydroxy acid dehydrogenase YdfG
VIEADLLRVHSPRWSGCCASTVVSWVVRSNILITGASSGLGAEMARQFTALGRNVALCARRTERLEQLKDELGSAWPNCHVAIRTLDVNDHESVFKTFHELDEELGGLDRVIVNAGVSGGYPVGTGRFEVNRATVCTNFLSGLAQCEAAMEIFRERGDGHLAVISSLSAMRGMRRHGSAYAASKAAMTNLAEGIRSDVYGTRIRVTTIFPGIIRTEGSDGLQTIPFRADIKLGVAAMVRAMEREARDAVAPVWPWAGIGFLVRHAPLRLLARVW